jgi:DNA polymerase-4
VDGTCGSRGDAGPAGEAVGALVGDERTVLHVDLDAFFASVEQLRYPQLRGKPVIVGNGVIASCSYEARRYGCYAGQPLSEARRVCPGVVILDGSEAVYRAFAEKTFAVCAGLSPAMETFLDEAFLELTGTERLHGDLRERGAALKRRVREEVGLPVTVGLGPNRMLAKIASKSVKPDGLRWIRAGEVEEALPALPIDRLPGVGYRVGRELRKLNVRTIGDLRAFSAEVLERMFGAPGRALYERCRGRDTRPVEVREVPRSVSRETAFHRPVTDPAEMEGMLYYLLERAVRHARGLGLSARTIQVWIDYEDSGRAAAARSLATPSDQDAVFFERARTLLTALHTRREAVRRIGTALSRFSADAAHQSELFEAGADLEREKLYRSLDLVRSRFGHASVVAGPSVRLLGRLEQDRNGFVLRTPSLTK